MVPHTLVPIPRIATTKVAVSTAAAHPMWTVGSCAVAAVVGILGVCIAMCVVIHGAVVSSAEQAGRNDFNKEFVVSD